MFLGFVRSKALLLLLFSTPLIINVAMAELGYDKKTQQDYYLKQILIKQTDNFLASATLKLRSFPYLHKAYHLLDNKSFIEAKQEFQRYLEIDPVNLNAREAYIILLYQIKEFREVIQQSNLALKQQQNLVPIILYRALAKKASGNREGALADYNAAINSIRAGQKEKEFAFNMSAILLFEQKFFQQSLTMLDQLPSKLQDFDFFMRYAMTKEGLNELNSAKQNYLQALTKARKNIEYVKAHSGLGALYQKQKLPDKARSAYQTALNLDPNNPELLRTIARLLYEVNQFEQALVLMQKALKQRFDLEDQEFLANIQFANKDFLAAAESYTKILSEQKEDKDKYRVYMLLGYSYSKANEQVKAIEAFQNASTLKKSIPTVQSLAKAYEKKNEIKRAVKKKRKPISKIPNAANFIELSKLYVKAGDRKNALKTLSSAFQLGLANRQKKTVLTLQGELLYQSQQYEKAKTAFEKAVSIDSSDPVLLNSLAMTNIKLGNLQQASNYLKKSLSLQETVKGWLTLAEIEKSLDNSQQPLQIYRYLLQLEGLAPKEKIPALENLGLFYLEKGQPQMVVGYLEAAAARGASSWELNRNLGTALAQLERWKEALEQYEIALSKHKNPLNLLNVAIAYKNIDKPGISLEYYQKALTLAEQSKDKQAIKQVMDELGSFYAAQKEHDKAKKIWKKSLAMRHDPVIEMRITMLEELKGNEKAVLSKLEKIDNRKLTAEQNAERFDFIAQLYSRKKLFARAVDAQQQALALQETPARHFFLGSFYQFNSEIKKALPHFIAASKQQPDNQGYAKALALAYSENDQVDMSTKILEKILKQDPKNLNLQKALAFVNRSHSNKGEKDKRAIKRFVKGDEAVTNTANVIRRNNRRPDDQFTVDIFGSPLTIGGEFETSLEYSDNVSLENDDPDYEASIDPSLSLEFLYQISDSMSFFADGTLFYSREYGVDEGQSVDVERGQSWLLFEEIFDSSFDIKIGPQYFADERTWWWDNVLDGISVGYFGDDWEGEIGITQALIPVATQDDIEPNDKELSRLLGRLSLEYVDDHWIEFFYTMQYDHSHTEKVGDIINVNREDDTDADAYWLGLRTYGTWETDKLGDFDYWLDLGYMDGDETTIDTSDEDDESELVMVEEVDTSPVRGWALDAGLKWHTDWLLEPTLTLGYAISSGKLDEDGSLRYAYQQTDLEGNSDFFGDVNYLSYYGELLAPQLSNLKIFTLGISIPLYTRTSFDIVYHKYDQYKIADFLQDVALNTDPDGNNKDIGQEIDIILGIRESKNWEILLVGSIFKAGNAFEEDAGKIFSGLSFQFNNNF